MRRMFCQNALMIVFVSLFIVSCQKSIEETAIPEEARTGVQNQGRGVTPYKFERINEHNSAA